jgi:hypothetical protein
MRIFIAMMLLAATTAMAGDRELVQAAIDNTCSGAADDVRARNLCEACFRQSWPAASRCANRCEKGRGHGACITNCNNEFKLEMMSCIYDATR